MTSPFDKAIDAIAAARYHNHRHETHSDTVSTALFDDLKELCSPLRDDVENGIVKVWPNVSAPGDRLRKHGAVAHVVDWLATTLRKMAEWALQDLNLRPSDYESAALTS